MQVATLTHPGTPPDQNPRPPATDNFPAPSVRQRRRPAVIGLALALIAVCALAGAFVATRGSDPVKVLLTARDIRAGQPLTFEDFTVVDLGPAISGVVPAENQQELVGQYLRSDLPAGSVVNPAMIQPVLTPGPGASIVGIGAKPGQLPDSGLKAGDRVRVVMGYAQAAPAGAAGSIKPGTGWTGTVVAVSEARDSGTRVVDVTLPEEQAEAIASVAATGALSITRLAAQG